MASDLLADQHCSRRLEASERLRDEFTHLRRLQASAWTRLHDRDDFLTEPVTRSTDHQDILDIGMLSEYFLDLLDEDLFTAGVHHHRVATEHDDRAVVSKSRPVARHGNPPAIDDR